MSHLNSHLKKIKLHFSKEKKLNQSVEDEMIAKNASRLVVLIPAIGVVNLAHIFYFIINFTPTTLLEEKWVTGIVFIHAVSAVIALILTLTFIHINKKKATYLHLKIIENFVALFILILGISLVSVDQYVTTNITPFLVVCTVLGLFIIKRPLAAILQYAVALISFFVLMTIFQTEPAILATNQLNGITFVAIGLCISLLSWHSGRSAILQQRKITEQHHKLEEIAYYDHLTGLINRWKWLQYVDVELEKNYFPGKESCILLLDIDFFKQVNDQYGHPIGDQVLKQLAQILKNEVGSQGDTARWGGEEFIILLPGVSLSKSIAIGEQIRQRIAQTPFNIENHQIHITVSLGATLLEHDSDFMDAYKRADQALYIAKNNGRNRLEYIVDPA
ncbi:GGDEF domain-containing protein [Acetobacterium woodii]|uniref:Diguanylate cyclase Dgc1 n=1 Tax=Acetobacterium woodii (strain ATCC 29683 / DSM 1030 / JCM 2381 / KCTC 1655 / WB1) TaxID=931626 RepID=H6LJE5_ACEWD|nr:GGDEF domain-containing protein [Acetobacterium woodii]AFA49873.1 diguanylate cyclase Dgc1 [Acetobacterium woodii DSM 1030]